MQDWKVQVKGERCGRAFEISVVRESNEHGQASWGWFNENKFLISHNGGPCNWPLTPTVWDHMISVAIQVCIELNDREKESGIPETYYE